MIKSLLKVSKGKLQHIDVPSVFVLVGGDTIEQFCLSSIREAVA